MCYDNESANNLLGAINAVSEAVFCAFFFDDSYQFVDS